VGCTIQWGISDLQRLRGILEIRSPGLFLPSPDLSVGIFIRVIGHFWQQGRVIEGFSLLLEHGILQLESLAFRYACIDLHFLFILWRHYFVLMGAFCSSSYLLSIVYHLGHLLSIPDQHLHCSRFFYFICWLWSLIIFLMQRSLLSAVSIPHEVFTPQKYVHSSTRGSAEGGYPLCGVRGVHPPGWGVWGQAGVRGRSPRSKNCLIKVYCNFIVNLDRSL
jgi:hypothetical protein